MKIRLCEDKNFNVDLESQMKVLESEDLIKFFLRSLRERRQTVQNFKEVLLFKLKLDLLV